MTIILLYVVNLKILLITLIDNRIVAIIMDLDDATEVNVAKYSSYKNIDNIQIPLIVGGNFTGKSFLIY